MNGIKLSPKYGVNPTIPVCFWCGKERNEVALMGLVGNQRKHEDIEMPMHAVIDYEPCDECKKHMSQGFTVMSATRNPNDVTSMAFQEGVYPTGRFVVIKQDAAERIFGKDVCNTDKAFLDEAAFLMIFGNGGV